jgi:probable HAF family extracellular repeat protein
VRRLLTALVIVLVAEIAAATPAAAEARFSSSAKAISDTGWIVGEVQVPNSARCVASEENVCVRAAIFATDEGLVGVRKLGTLGGPSSRFTGVNSNGTIVGSAETAQPEPDFGGFVFKAVLSQRGGPLVDLGTLGGRNAQAQSISEAGKIVGLAQTSSGGFHAFVKSPGKAMTDLGTLPGGTSSAANVISGNGRYVTGFGDIAGGETRGFVWDGVAMRVLPPLPGGHFSRGNSVNSQGVVVGTSFDADGNVHAVIWHGDTPSKLAYNAAGFSRGTSIADSGVVVGWRVLQDGRARAFITNAWGGPSRLLPALGPEAIALAVNDQGDAVGDSLTGGNDPNGIPRYEAVLYRGDEIINLAA